jgi:hypothetical protein
MLLQLARLYSHAFFEMCAEIVSGSESHGNRTGQYRKSCGGIPAFDKLFIGLVRLSCFGIFKAMLLTKVLAVTVRFESLGNRTVGIEAVSGPEVGMCTGNVAV